MNSVSRELLDQRGRGLPERLRRLRAHATGAAARPPVPAPARAGRGRRRGVTSSPWVFASSRNRSVLATRAPLSEARRLWKTLEDRRAGGRGRDLAAVEVGVAAVQQPAVAGVDGDAGVAARVADERDQRHLDVDAGQDPHALEAEPAVAARLGAVLGPARAVLEVGAAVARSLVQARVQRRRQLRREDVDLGIGEVGQAAGMVDVEVGGDDVPYVGRRRSRAPRPGRRPSPAAAAAAGAGRGRAAQAGPGCARRRSQSRCRRGSGRRSSRSAGSGRPR